MDFEVGKTIELNPQEVYFVLKPEGLLYQFCGTFTRKTIKLPADHFVWTWRQMKRNRKMIINYPGLFQRLFKNFKEYDGSIHAR